MLTNGNEQQPITDLSRPVIYLARQLDRLPPGNYVIHILKPDPPLDWQAEICLETSLRILELWWS